MDKETNQERRKQRTKKNLDEVEGAGTEQGDKDLFHVCPACAAQKLVRYP